MKTIKEWLSELPEPYKNKALKYCINTGNDDCVSLLNAIDSISWQDTEEGFDFWQQVENYIVKGDPLPYAGQTEIPTNALSAIHAIAFKEGFPAEAITDIVCLNGIPTKGLWKYRKVNNDNWFNINLSN